MDFRIGSSIIRGRFVEPAKTRGRSLLNFSPSYRVVRKSLLRNCLGAPTPARLLALRDVLLGFLPGSKRTVHLDCVPGQVLRA